jgi:hypothetical protein
LPSDLRLGSGQYRYADIHKSNCDREQQHRDRARDRRRKDRHDTPVPAIAVIFSNRVRRDPGPQKRRHFNVRVVARKQFLFRSQLCKARRTITTRDQMLTDLRLIGRRQLAVEILFQKL